MVKIEKIKTAEKHEICKREEKLLPIAEHNWCLGEYPTNMTKRTNIPFLTVVKDQGRGTLNRETGAKHELPKQVKTKV